MSNALFALGRQGFLDGSINWASDTIKTCLVGAGYAPDLAGDQFLSDVPSDQIIATSAAFTGKDETAGVADADNVTLSAVAGPQGNFIVVYKDTGDATTSRLIALIDTANGLPCTPNGGSITIAWDTGANRIFTL
jgi:hypothetical protein